MFVPAGAVNFTNDELVYVAGLAVPAGGPPGVAGPVVSWDTFSPDCITLFVVYTPGTPGNKLTITAEFGDALGFFPLSQQTAIQIDKSSAITLALGGGKPPKLKLFFQTSAGGPPDDTVSVNLTGVFPGVSLS